MNIYGLPDFYMIARYRYLTEELSKLPKVSKGHHCGKDVYRIIIDGEKHCYGADTKKGSGLGKIYQKRSKMESSIKTLLSSFDGDLRSVSKEYSILMRSDAIFDGDFYRRANENASPYKNDYIYELNGIRYRSRGEMMIAQVLTDMGLEFKYECPINCGDRCYSADFLIYLPEFNRCFILEYLGRLDDEEYIMKNSRKIRDYLLKGLYFGRDMVFLCGDRYETPTAEQIWSAVYGIIRHISAEHLVLN